MCVEVVAHCNYCPFAALVLVGQEGVLLKRHAPLPLRGTHLRNIVRRNLVLCVNRQRSENLRAKDLSRGGQQCSMKSSYRGVTYESAARVRGEDGALIVLASEGAAPKLETDDTD